MAEQHIVAEGDRISIAPRAEQAGGTVQPYVDLTFREGERSIRVSIRAEQFPGLVRSLNRFVEALSAGRDPDLPKEPRG